MKRCPKSPDLRPERRLRCTGLPLQRQKANAINILTPFANDVKGEPGEMGHWYIVQTNPQQERKAAGEVRRLALEHGGDFRAYLPKWSRVVYSRKAEPKVKFRPLYVGYIFVRFPDGFYNDLADCDGVRRILKTADGNPAIVPLKVISALLRHQRSMKNENEQDRIYRMGRRRGAPASFDAAMSQALFDGATHGLVVAGPWAEKTVEIVGIAASGLVEAQITLMGVESRKAFKPLVEIIPVGKAAAVEHVREAA